MFPFENAVSLFWVKIWSTFEINIWSRFLKPIVFTHLWLTMVFSSKLKGGRGELAACCLFSGRPAEVRVTSSWNTKNLKKKIQHFFAFLHSLTHASRLLNCLKRMGMLEMRWNTHWSIFHCALPYLSVVFTNLPPGQQSWWQTRQTWSGVESCQLLRENSLPKGFRLC